VHELVSIVHVHTNGAFQYNEDATAAVISCLKQGLIGLDHHLRRWLSAGKPARDILAVQCACNQSMLESQVNLMGVLAHGDW